MKSLLELYTMLLERFKSNNPYNEISDRKSYICNNIDELAEDNQITKEEHVLLKKHFVKEKPSRKKHVAFYNHSLFNKGEVWFRTYGSEKLAFSLRVQLLTNIIANLKEEDASNK